LAKFPGANGLSKVPNFLVKSTFEHKTTKFPNKMAILVKKEGKRQFSVFLINTFTPEPPVTTLV